ncbi:MAG: YceH family protein [Acidobacteria bacterium]|nr:YceH family protein [Acidobacteriota bacterium]MCG3191888.1 hypothetical protein [Thermoanaerobaculia bacterium]MCK6681787.1 DUF480 domain-containing protein [Thermoanaerobaculia bacterium]
MPSFPRQLDPVEVRVLGSLIEKQLSTPEYYPMTLNALVAACNQKTSRDPVMDLSEQEVLAALERLREFVLVWKISGGRAERWEQNLDTKLVLDAESKAILGLLFLRGPQTPGELRARSARLYAFETLGEVEEVLRRLSEGPEPLVAELPRRPGQSETRWAHTAMPLPKEEAFTPPASPSGPSVTDRVAALEERIARLETELKELKARLGEH